MAKSGEGGCHSSMPTILDILFLPSLFTLTPGKASLTRRERFVTLRLSPGNDLSSSSVPQTTAQIPQNSLGTMHVVHNLLMYTNPVVVFILIKNAPFPGVLRCTSGAVRRTRSSIIAHVQRSSVAVGILYTCI